MVLKYWRWLTSRRVRQATELKKQVIKFRNHQRDILSPENVKALEEGVAKMDEVLAAPRDAQALDDAMTELERTASDNIKPYRDSGIRENVEVVLVAVAIALGIRTFFLQPFKIPTGSMQPTLYGITHEDLRNDADFEMPGLFARIFDRCVKGEKFVEVIAREAGQFSMDSVEYRQIFPFVHRLRFNVGNETYTVWNPPNELLGGRYNRSGLYDGAEFEAGDPIMRLKVTTGDHLLVDRFTYNFRRPTRGEIIVFKTEGIVGLDQRQFYIKRLVGLPNETISIGTDQHAVVDGKRLDGATPRFENVYTFDPEHYELNTYFGHVNGIVGRRWSPSANLAPLFFNGAIEVKVRPDHYMVFGDNTLNSHDSRGWGDFPQSNVIGKQAFVYWPITERFGWSAR